jgi:nitrous oxidase accessory protein
MRQILLLLLVFVFLTASSVIVFVPVNAGSRTIVVPDDYPTISLAVENALAGDTVLVKKGSYNEETLEISKPISLVGEGCQETIVNFDPPLVEVWIFYYNTTVPVTAIVIDTDDFVLSGFTINMPAGMFAKDKIAVTSGFIATGDRIELVGNKISSSLQLSGDLLNICDNEIAGSLAVAGSNQTVMNNSIRGGFDGRGSFNRIIDNAIGEDVTLSGSSFNLIIGNSFLSMYMGHSDSNFISNNSFITLWLGFEGRACSNNTVSANKVVGPGLWGILMSAGSYNVFHDNLICNFTGSYSGYGIAIGGNHLVAEYNTFYRNILMNNNRNVGTNWEVLGAGNFWDNSEVGNFWDDYAGVDSDRDGIGDVPHIVKGCKWDDAVSGLVEFVFGQDNFPLMTPFDVDSVSIDYPKWAYALLDPSFESQPENSEPSSKTELESELFPIALFMGSVFAVTIVCLGLFFYYQKRRGDKRS